MNRFLHHVVFMVVVSLFIAVVPAFADVTLSGHVVADDGKPIAGALLSAGLAHATSGDDGSFTIVVAPTAREINVTHPRYLAIRVPMVPKPAEPLTITLSPAPIVSESMVVSAIRADDATPVTKKDLGKSDIDERYYGQDMPALISATPSITTYSESGMGMNYSYITLRGIGMTRLNFTLDGVPLNDPAENALYFNNFTDFGGAVDSVQIQRGVGTSTVGSPSYGGSINFTSMPLAELPEVAAQLTAGSFGTERGAVEFQSGQLANGFAFYGRATANQTDGFRDHSGVDQHSFYFNAAYRTDDSILKLVALSGREKTHLSFYATDEATLEEDIRNNPLDPAETDDFGQDLVELQYTKALGTSSSVTATAYYNGAQGWFALWNDETTKEFLQKYWIDQQTIGLMATLNQERGPLTLNYGIHANDFSGDHYQTVEGEQQYFNTGYKNEENAFVKAGYDIGRWHLYGDAQFRHAKFRYDGDIDLGSVDWSFFNPKVGARFRVAPGLSIYGSLGRASREPTRVDMLSGEDNATVVHDLEAVRPERVLDYELGTDWSTPRGGVAVNLYAMEFHDEIALTGELSDIGLPLRRNVDQSYRRGVEIDFRYKLAETLGISGNTTFSHNRIRNWTQYVDVYGDDGSYVGSEPLAYHNVAPLLTPDVTANLTASWAALPWLGLEATGRYVGESYLDNTQDDRFTTPSFVNLDLKASVGLERFWQAGHPRLNVFLNNALDNDRIYSSGYSYLYLTRGNAGTESLDGISYFYPTATRHVMVTLDVKM